MSKIHSEHLFGDQNSPQINLAEASANTTFSNYSQSASAILTDAQTDTLIKNGVGNAIANAAATFNNDPAFSTLFTQAIGIGVNGANIKSSSETTAIGSFTVAANQRFSFNFSANIAELVTKVQKPRSGYNEAESKTAFLILDTSDINQPKVLDYFGLLGDLSSPNDIHSLKLSGSKNVQIQFQNKQYSDGINYAKSLNDTVFGTYSRSFNKDTKITVVEINDSTIQLLSNASQGNDSLIGRSSNSPLVGSSDHDSFVVQKDDFINGNHEINNFNPAQDTVDFEGFGDINPSNWFNGIVSQHQLIDTANGALLHVAPGEDILFKGISAPNLSQGNFHFSN